MDNNIEVETQSAVIKALKESNSNIALVKAIKHNKYLIYLLDNNRATYCRLVLIVLPKKLILRNYVGNNLLRQLGGGSSILAEEHENESWNKEAPAERGRHVADFFYVSLKGLQLRDRINLERKISGGPPSPEKIQQLADIHFGAEKKAKIDIS